MSTVLRPVGPEPAGVYWKRRLVVTAVVAVVLLVAWLVVSGAVGQQKKTGGAPKPPAPSTSTSAKPPSASAPCTKDALLLTVTPSKTTYAKGEKPAFSVAVTNSGDHGCSVDAGDKSREVRVVSGSDRIWSSKDCAKGEDASRTLLLSAGKRDTADVTWDRSRSNATCATDLPTPRPGTYKVQVFLLGAESDAVPFTLG